VLKIPLNPNLPSDCLIMIAVELGRLYTFVVSSVSKGFPYRHQIVTYLL